MEPYIKLFFLRVFRKWISCKCRKMWWCPSSHLKEKSWSCSGISSWRRATALPCAGFRKKIVYSYGLALENYGRILCVNTQFSVTNIGLYHFKHFITTELVIHFLYIHRHLDVYGTFYLTRVGETCMISAFL